MKFSKQLLGTQTKALVCLSTERKFILCLLQAIICFCVNFVCLLFTISLTYTEMPHLSLTRSIIIIIIIIQVYC